MTPAKSLLLLLPFLLLILLCSHSEAVPTFPEYRLRLKRQMPFNVGNFMQQFNQDMNIDFNFKFNQRFRTMFGAMQG
ncbi:hypothetical protein QR680_000404 [Steinernema hermaphroditum]|uniref:Uncharacterized protein n=1 Tax=Steinernema hermaphroditum TaxID=289476 RepID=A0AA39GX90_9BILA|nr:hypothetical protein QR680_000404 [Steinernema hermaphroditum]